MRAHTRQRAGVWAYGVALSLTSASRFGFAQSSAPSAPPDHAPLAPLSESLNGAAKLDYDAARLLYRSGDAAGAAIKFQRAYGESGDARLWWNVAVCHKALHHYVKMLEALEAYQHDGAGALSAAELSEADALATSLRPLIGSFSLEVSQPGALVSIDDEAIGTTPLPAAVRLDLGPHRLSTSKAGYSVDRRVLEVVGGEHQSLRVVLERELPEGRVVVRSPFDATIVIDDRPTATGGWEGPLAVGRHTLRVTAAQKAPYQTSFSLSAGQVVTLYVVLENQPAKGLGPVPWVLGGALVLAGAIVGGYFALHKTEATAPLPAGSLGTAYQPPR